MHRLVADLELPPIRLHDPRHGAATLALAEIAHRLNTRPRKTLEFMTPSRKLSKLLH